MIRPVQSAAGDGVVRSLTHHHDFHLRLALVTVQSQVVAGICGRVGRATASVWGDGGSIPTGGALEVWPCDFGPKQFGWLINQLGEP